MDVLNRVLDDADRLLTAALEQRDEYGARAAGLESTLQQVLVFLRDESRRALGLRSTDGLNDARLYAERIRLIERIRELLTD